MLSTLHLWAREFAVIAALATLAWFLACSEHSAAADGDGLYGRFDRDTDLIMNAGFTYSKQREFAALTETRFLFANTAGPMLSLSWPKSSNLMFIAGLDARPLFPAMFFLDLSTGRPRLDLLIQSLGVELGVASPLDGERALAFDTALALAFPLIIPHEAMQGFWLRVGGRRIVGRARFRPSGGESIAEWSFFCTLDVGVGFRTSVQSWEPPNYRPR